MSDQGGSEGKTRGFYVYLYHCTGCNTPGFHVQISSSVTLEEISALLDREVGEGHLSPSIAASIYSRAFQSGDYRSGGSAKLHLETVDHGVKPLGFAGKKTRTKVKNAFRFPYVM